MRALPLVLAGLLFALARAALPAGEPWGPGPTEGRPWHPAELGPEEGPGTPAAVALAAAAGKRRALVGATAAEVPALREAAVAAALGVVQGFPDEPEAVEAAFRAGELRRAGGDPAAALAHFRRAAELGRGTALGARARYEAGHVLRREGRWSEALTVYERVHHDGAATAARRDLAGLWLARARVELGQDDEAERLLRRLVDDAVDPVTRVRVYDLLIERVVARGDLAAAAGWLDACKASVHAESVEETRRGRRVRAALEDLRGLELLRAAIASQVGVPR